MDNKVTKNRINNHLEYDWFKYILLIAAGVALVVFIFSRINSNRQYETFTMFLTAYSASMESDTYESAVLRKMDESGYDADEYGPNLLRAVTLDINSPTTNEYSQLFMTRGTISSDVIVAGKNYFKSDNDGVEIYPAAMGFLELTPQIFNLLRIDPDDYELIRLNDNAERVESGGKIFGIRIDPNDNPKGLSKLGSLVKMKYESAESDDKEYDSEFFLYINRSGRNIGTFNPKAKPDNNQTFFCLRYFFERYK